MPFPDNNHTATRFSSQLKAAFGINVSQIELLGSVTIGVLDDIVAKSCGGDAGKASATALDGGSSKYRDPLVPILNDRLAYNEPYNTDASPHKCRIWLPSEVEKSPITQIDSKAILRYNNYVATTSATPFAAFSAIYNSLLYKYFAQNPLVVGTAVTQRSTAQLQDVIGFFANMLPIRITIEDDMTFVEYLNRFGSGLVTDLMNDDVTYEDIVSQTKSSSQRRSYFKCLFAPDGLNMRIVNQSSASEIFAASILSFPNCKEKYEFLLTVNHKTGKTILQFDNYLYTEETARQFFDVTSVSSMPSERTRMSKLVISLPLATTRLPVSSNCPYLNS